MSTKREASAVAGTVSYTHLDVYKRQARIMAAGAKRVTVIAPVYTKLMPTQVANCSNTKAELGGLEDA